jgi:hypothetical protein
MRDGQHSSWCSATLTTTPPRLGPHCKLVPGSFWRKREDGSLAEVRIVYYEPVSWWRRLYERMRP